MISYRELNTKLLVINAPKQWFPNAKEHGSSLRIGSLKGEKGSSLWICRLTGRWFDHATGEGGGDLISLYAAMHNISQSQAKTELEGEGLYKVSQAPKLPKAPKMLKAADPEKLAYISNLWAESIPVKFTQVETYLRSRAIDKGAFKDIRYIPELFHKPSENSFPVMLAAVRHGETGQLMAIHRTWLKHDGSGKADIEPNKMMLGQVLGGAVQLAEAAPEIIVAEGIETALSVMQITGTPTWAALSTAGLKGLVLPLIVKHVVIACDNDLVGLHAAKLAKEKWLKEGREVLILTPASHKDFNDLLREIKSNGYE